MFSTKSTSMLSKMKVDIPKYFRDLDNHFKKNTIYFDNMISELHFVESLKNKDLFLEFCEKNKIAIDSSLFFNSLYEMFCNLCRYNQKGVWGVFKEKDASWITIKVDLCKEDVPKFDNTNLAEEIIIYRGMSKSEYQEKKFTQHWTTNIEVASQFAFDTYSDLPRGIVIKGKISKYDVLHFDSSSYENEIVPIISKIKDIKIIRE